MANWSELIPLDIWKKIAESIQFHEDLNVFGKVCSDWRKAMKIANRSKSSIQTPWLLLAEPPCTSTRRFYSLYNRKVLPVELPKPSTTPGQAEDDTENMTLSLLFPPDKDEDGLGDWRYYSSRGWLISVTQLGLNITLVNPITKQVVQPPPFPDHIFGSRTRSWQWQPNSYLFMYDKFVLSEDPSTTKDYVLAMKFPASVDLAFWKSGDKQWNMLNNTHYCHFSDITFHKGEFYAVEQFGKIIAVGNSSPPATPRLVANLMFQCTSPHLSYLVESAGTLLLIFRELEDLENKTLELKCFKVWEINVDTGEAKETTSLGNRAVFLGHNSSFSVEACPPICRPNCIYYTDNYDHNYRFSNTINRCDMGVYDISLDRKIEEFYQGPSCLSKSTLPLWVESPN